MKARRAGKKRLLDVERQPNGQPRRQKKPAITPEALAKREALCKGDKGLALTEAPGRASALLVCWGILTTRQAEAVERYRAAIIAYQSVEGFPSRSAQVANIGIMPDGVDVEANEARHWQELMTPDERAQRVRRIRQRADELYSIVGSGTLRRQIIDRIAIDDVAPVLWSQGIYSRCLVDALKRTCDEIAGYFRITCCEPQSLPPSRALSLLAQA